MIRYRRSTTRQSQFRAGVFGLNKGGMKPPARPID
jgi:hypothetical protein